MAIGIDTVVLLILAFLVIAFILYLIIKTSKTPTLDCSTCRAEFTEYCKKCYNSMCSLIEIESDLCDCINNCGISCNKDKKPKCNDLQTQCLSVGIAYGC